jgi:DNA-binding NarL/FixJ family response regulator
VSLVLPDVVLMDFSMPGMNGIEATQIIHKEVPDVRIIGLSMFEESEIAAAMLSAGAVGYKTKSGPSAAVLVAIRTCISPGRIADGTANKGESNKTKRKNTRAHRQ